MTLDKGSQSKENKGDFAIGSQNEELNALAAWKPLYKGVAAPFPLFHLQQLGLERESRERKCRFGVSKFFNFFTFRLFWFLMVC